MRSLADKGRTSGPFVGSYQIQYVDDTDDLGRRTRAHPESIEYPWDRDKKERRRLIKNPDDSAFYEQVWARLVPSCRYYKEDPHLTLGVYRGQVIVGRLQVD